MISIKEKFNLNYFIHEHHNGEFCFSARYSYYPKYSKERLFLTDKTQRIYNHRVLMIKKVYELYFKQIYFK